MNTTAKPRSSAAAPTSLATLGMGADGVDRDARRALLQRACDGAPPAA